MRRSQSIQVYKRFAMMLAIVLVTIYAVLNLSGPDGVSAFFAKKDELTKIDKENANLEKELRDANERVGVLKNSKEAREIVIREKTHKLKPGEKRYLVPDPEPKD